MEWNNRWAPLPWLLVDADLAWTHGRFRGGDPATAFIPNSVDRLASLGLSAQALGPWSASLHWRLLGAGPLTEDNSQRSPQVLTSNLRIGRSLGRSTSLTLDVFNLANRRVNDIEYVYASQLKTETQPVIDRHVHPAEPRSLRLTLKQDL